MFHFRLIPPRTKVESIIMMLVILTSLSPEVSATCKRRLSVKTITVNDCLPKRLLTYTCSGTCSTHAQVSSTNPFDTRTCYQCIDTALRDRRVKVKCPSKDATSRFLDVYVTVKVPGGCMCQECDVKMILN